MTRIPHKPAYRPPTPLERRQAVLNAGVPEDEVDAVLAGRPFVVKVTRG